MDEDLLKQYGVFGKNPKPKKEETKLRKYILFDLDGTLTDPKVGICTCVQYALASFGIDEPDLDVLEPFIGPPLLDSFKEFYGFSEEDATKAVAKYRERFADVGIFENALYPGIKHMLKTLKKYGFHLAVASSKPEPFVNRILEHFHIAQYFEVVAGSNLDGTRTDKREVIEYALRKLFPSGNVDREQIYMVGDRKFDVIGAAGYGIPCVAVGYGYGDYEELIEAKADYIVATTAELEEFLMRETNDAAEGRISHKKGVGEPLPMKTITMVVVWFLVFSLARTIASMAFTYFFNYFGLMLGDARPEFLFFASDNELGFELTGSAAVIISAISYSIGAIPLLIPLKQLLRHTKLDMRLLHLFTPEVWQYVLAVVFTASTVIAIQTFVTITGLAANSQTYQNVAESQYNCTLWVGLIVYGIVAPLAEETLFRGVIYTSLRRYLPINVSIILSAMMFALYHGNMVQGVYALVMGMIMAYAFEYFGTFLAPVLVHALSNTLSFVMTYTHADTTFLFTWPGLAVMVVISVVSAVMLIRKKKK